MCSSGLVTVMPIRTCHALLYDVRWVNLPFLPCSLSERWMTKALTLKTSDSAQAPFEMRDALIADHIFALPNVSCYRLF